MHPTEIKKESKETPKQNNSIFLKATFFIIGIVSYGNSKKNYHLIRLLKN
jgi:hypothetical protein